MVSSLVMRTLNLRKGSKVSQCIIRPSFMLFHTRCPLLPPSLKAPIVLYSDIQAEVIPQSKEHVTSRLGIKEKTSTVIMEISMKGFGGN